ncbi:peroxisome assembly protein per8 [Fomitopsis serialis]|uniref:peroxisome assembly protein per8 n=1 Tax=Fomitopsis serialis TaxID=139415 RepID=UPI002007E89C|nr:peroxisome assembly protein per8 [Neoantrodia serialis]KAH9921442.1 peroxisome assembly protein per8 [Neoantrodia serialis]
MPLELLSFPPAQQPQIIRSHQRDFFQVSALREQADGVLRAWLGTRWLSRWDKEVELCTKLLYFGLTVGRATQTLGEEYTDIWIHSMHSEGVPPWRARAALVLLPTLPSYALARWGSYLAPTSRLTSLVRKLPTLLEIISEVNLAMFYFRGTYYDLVKRMLGIRYVNLGNSSRPKYEAAFVFSSGYLLAVRLLHRLVSFIRSSYKADVEATERKGKRPVDDHEEIYIDDRPISTMIGRVDPDEVPPLTAEEDERTVLDFSQMPPTVRGSRNCTLCLEERTATTSTECGHLFCWDCIVGWGREKAECPLCRQSLNLTSLLPIYNL